MTWTQAIRVQSRRTAAARAKTAVLWWRLAVLAAFLVLWWAVSVTGVLPATLVPDPIEVVSVLVSLIPTAEFWAAIWATVGAALLGLAAATVVGIPLGVLIGRSDRADLSTRFLIDFGRAFPAIALVGVLVLMLGRGIEMQAVLVWIAVIFPIAIQTQHGVRRINPMIEETCRAFRIPAALHVWKVLFPNAAPFIMTGLRLAASVAVLVAISAEVLTGAPGLGYNIVTAQMDSNAPKAFAFIVVAGLLGYLANVGVAAVQRSMIRWRPQGTED